MKKLLTLTLALSCFGLAACDSPDPEPSCNDGQPLSPFCDVPPVCQSGLIAAQQNGCWECVDANTCEPPEQGGGECGGLLGLFCDDGEFCDWQPGEFCGAADHLGSCEVIPEVCIQVFDPVCGCDGNTYSNSCTANASGISVASEGACEQ